MVGINGGLCKTRISKEIGVFTSVAAYATAILG
jgi:hypothetical protein